MFYCARFGFHCKQYSGKNFWLLVGGHGIELRTIGEFGCSRAVDRLFRCLRIRRWFPRHLYGEVEWGGWEGLAGGLLDGEHGLFGDFALECAFFPGAELVTVFDDADGLVLSGKGGDEVASLVS